MTFIAVTSTHAQDVSDKFSVHGYLTQAYAKSDKIPTSGITRDGTWDYRVFALQMRYAATDNDQVVMQVRNRRIGTSLLSDDGVQLDWAYYAHNFGPLVAKIGKAPLPLGLYNEIRSVGTILPFYRAPSTFYREGVETIKGIVLSTRLPLGAWSLESTVFGGGTSIDVPTPTPFGVIRVKFEAEENYGTQMWLNTPIPGLRVGGTWLRFQAKFPTDTSMNNAFVGSVDGTFDRFFVRGEYQRLKLAGFFPNGDETQILFHGQAGMKLFGPLSLNVQEEGAHVTDLGYTYRDLDDHAVGVNYALESNMVFKVEAHRRNGYNFDTYLAPTGPAGKSSYGIASMSVSF